MWGRGDGFDEFAVDVFGEGASLPCTEVCADGDDEYDEDEDGDDDGDGEDDGVQSCDPCGLLCFCVFFCVCVCCARVCVVGARSGIHVTYTYTYTYTQDKHGHIHTARTLYGLPVSASAQRLRTKSYLRFFPLHVQTVDPRAENDAGGHGRQLSMVSRPCVYACVCVYV